MAKRRRSVEDRPALRLRARRAASAFLKLQREAAAPVEMFEAARVEQMLRSGRPNEAEVYLQRFLVPLNFEDRSPLSRLLLIHARVFRILAKVAGGGEEGASYAALFANPSERELRSPYSARLHEIIAVMSADQASASKLWQDGQRDAVDRIMDEVARCPELQGDVRVPRMGPSLWHVAPQGLRECPSRCKKTTNRTPTDVLVRKFLRKRLLSVQGKNHAAHSRNASSRSVKPHMNMERIAPQAAVSEDLDDIPPTMASPAKTSGISSHQQLMQQEMENVESAVPF